MPTKGAIGLGYVDPGLSYARIKFFFMELEQSLRFTVQNIQI
jgi:hypothetical protein